MKKLPRSQCLHCGNPCKRATTKFCSTECYSAYRHENNIRVGGPARTVKERPCQHCGIIFLPKDYKNGQKYCTMKCAGLARADQTAALGRSRKGVKYSAEVRSKMSAAASAREANTCYTKGRGGRRQDLGHYVRSSWEANIARILLHEGLDYQYEPKTFVLVDKDGTEIRYTPDFYCLNHYLEVKGWWDAKSQKKKQLFAEQYPHEQIEYVDEPVYRQLEQGYRNVIDTWE